jgi:sulfur carrier protein ThiS
VCFCMKVTSEKTRKTINFKKGFKKASDLLKELNISPDTVLVVKNKEVVLLEEPLGERDEIILLSVVSGG